jgi:hypothetical protein
MADLIQKGTCGSQSIFPELNITDRLDAAVSYLVEEILSLHLVGVPEK